MLAGIVQFCSSCGRTLPSEKKPSAFRHLPAPVGDGNAQLHAEIVIVVLAIGRRLNGYFIPPEQHRNQRLCRPSASSIIVQPEDDGMNFWILRQIPFQSQRRGAFLQFHLWPINAGQGNQMLPVPAAAILFDQGGIGKQINGTFKKMDSAAPRCGDAERVPFVAATQSLSLRLLGLRTWACYTDPAPRKPHCGGESFHTAARCECRNQ